jgi:sulfocyanin
MLRINKRGVSTTAAILTIIVIVLAVAIIYLYYTQIAGRGGQTPSYTTPVQTTQPSGGTKLPYDSASKTVYLVLDTRSNLDFNGSTRGRLVVYIPAGWNLEIKYYNKDPGNLPHSVGIIKNTTATPKSPDVTRDGELIVWAPDSAQGKAGFLTGIEPQKDTSLRASSVPEGVYWIACGVPGHASGGMWIVLVSSSKVSEPYYST